MNEIVDGLGVVDPLSSSSLSCASPFSFAGFVVPGTVVVVATVVMRASVPGKTARGVGGARVGCAWSWVCVG